MFQRLENIKRQTKEKLNLAKNRLITLKNGLKYIFSNSSLYVRFIGVILLFVTFVVLLQYLFHSASEQLTNGEYLVGLGYFGLSIILFYLTKEIFMYILEKRIPYLDS